MQFLTLVVTAIVLLGVVGYLFGTMFQSIGADRQASGLRKAWNHFGLSIAFSVLFLISWVAQAVAEWSLFVEEQTAHGRPADFSDFIVAFGQSTFENWQSEFLQLFSFVVLSAILIHRGSAESKDTEDEILAAVQRIEERFDGLDRASPRV